jgi:hypothetical protein
MEILEDLTNQGLKVDFTGEDLKNKLAWLAFEQVAWDIAYNDLQLEY